MVLTERPLWGACQAHYPQHKDIRHWQRMDRVITLSKLIKVAANEVTDGKSKRIFIKDRNIVTYIKSSETVYITREIICEPDGSTAGSHINLSRDLKWESGSAVSEDDLKEIQRDLIQTAELLGTRFVFE